VYVVIATKPVHRLQIRPIVHNYGIPYHSLKLHPVRAIVWECSDGQTDTQTQTTHTQTAVTAILFASCTTHSREMQ